MSIVIELVCKHCALEDCSKHRDKMIVRDQQTGLDIEARCVCRNH